MAVASVHPHTGGQDAIALSNNPSIVEEVVGVIQFAQIVVYDLSG